MSRSVQNTTHTQKGSYVFTKGKKFQDKDTVKSSKSVKKTLLEEDEDQSEQEFDFMKSKNFKGSKSEKVMKGKSYGKNSRRDDHNDTDDTDASENSEESDVDDESEQEEHSKGSKIRIKVQIQNKNATKGNNKVSKFTKVANFSDSESEESEAKETTKIAAKKEKHVADEPILNTLMKLSKQSKNVVLQEFVKLVYDNTHCVGGKLNGKLYKELPNAWSMRKTFTEEEKKFECTGDWTNDCTVSDKINKHVKGNVKLIWNFNKIKVDHSSVSLTTDEDWKVFNQPKVLGYFKKALDLRKKVFLTGEVHISSDSHDSEDHRGSNHCLIDLPVSAYVKLTNPTLEQLIEAFWAIKYKKFDKWYELCVGAVVSNEKGVTVIECQFDNGS